jgi:hypothetical protein
VVVAVAVAVAARLARLAVVAEVVLLPGASELAGLRFPNWNQAR